MHLCVHVCMYMCVCERWHTYQQNCADSDHEAQDADDKPCLVVRLDERIHDNVAHGTSDGTHSHECHGVIDLEQPQEHVLNRG